MFSLGEDHLATRDIIRRFLDREYPVEAVREIDEQDRYPREVLPKLAELGITGLTIAEEYGGVGRDVLGAIVVVEEMARRSLALAWVYVESAFFGSENIGRYGDEAQKRRYLPGLAAGELVFSYALTEPDAGSDTAAVSTVAERRGDALVVNGTKIFISGPNYADSILTLVRTDKTVAKHKGLSFVIIDAKSPGITAKPIKKVGTHGSDTCELLLQDVHVPLEAVLGGPEKLNQGWNQLLGTLDVEHAQVAAGAVGLAQGALDEAVKYAGVRSQFDQPIGRFQAIAHMLADMQTEIEAARLLTYRAASLAQDDQPCWVEASMAKLFATETAKKVALNAMQIHGGYGFTMEYDIQRYVRDSLMLTIGGGTSQIQRNIIAKSFKI